MRVHLVNLHPDAYRNMVDLVHSASPQVHELTDDAASAELILFVGGHEPWDFRPILDSPLPRRYGDKCFIYFDADGFVPLLPGIYANPIHRRFVQLRRTRAGNFIGRQNRFTVPTPAPKKYLFSFVGGSTSLLRKRLYRIDWARPDVLVRNSSNYHHWDSSQTDRETRQREYADIIASSHFALCPRGASSGSLRLFEAMQMGVAPVLVSDRYELPRGPDWDQFLIRVPERSVRRLPAILGQQTEDAQRRGDLARQAWLAWFAPDVMFNRMIESCVEISAARRIPESAIRRAWPLMMFMHRSRTALRAVARGAALRVVTRARLRSRLNLNQDER